MRIDYPETPEFLKGETPAPREAASPPIIEESLAKLPGHNMTYLGTPRRLETSQVSQKNAPPGPSWETPA